MKPDFLAESNPDSGPRITGCCQAMSGPDVVRNIRPDVKGNIRPDVASTSGHVAHNVRPDVTGPNIRPAFLQILPDVTHVRPDII